MTKNESNKDSDVLGDVEYPLDWWKNNCKKNGTEKCYDPENNRPNGVCVMWGCPQAGVKQ